MSGARAGGHDENPASTSFAPIQFRHDCCAQMRMQCWPFLL